MINILIPEETPSLNKGEAAIFQGMMETFKLLEDEVKVSMFSFDPATDDARHGSRVKIIDAWGIMPSAIMFKSKSSLYKACEYLLFIIKHFSFFFLQMIFGHMALKLMRRDVWQEYSQADLIIMAHDSAFVPLYHSILIFLFKYLNKKVVIYSSTITPSHQKGSFMKKILFDRLIKSSLSRVDLITLREVFSYQYIIKMVGDKVPVYLTGDLAFLVPAAPDERVHEIMKHEGINNTNPIIGITLSQNKVRVAFSDIKNYAHKEEKFISIMGQVIDHLIDELGAMVVFIPHCIVEGDVERDDRVLAQKVYQKVNNKNNVKVILNEYSAEEVKGLAGMCFFCIGTRLHFIVDACSMLVPFIIIANRDDYRVHGIIGEMIGLDKWIHDIDILTTEGLISKIDKGWVVREKTKKELQVAIELAINQTMQNGKLLNDLIMKRSVLHPSR